MKRPELEARTASAVHTLSSTTCVDLLEIYHRPKPKAQWTKVLDHDSLLEHVNKTNERSGRSSIVPALRVFFFGVQENNAYATIVVQAHPSTLKWLGDHIGVSSLFIESIIKDRRGLTGKTGNACFSKRNKQGRAVAIDGFYGYSNGIGTSFGRVWFSHNLSTRSTTYVTVNCSDGVKEEIVHCALRQNPESLTRPCAIDAFIANSYCSYWARDIDRARTKLLAYERVRATELPSPAHMAQAVETLHIMSQEWHIIYEDLTDAEETLELLLDVYKKYDTGGSGTQEEGTTRSLSEESSVDESLTYLISRNRIWRRWVTNYNERTKIRINLFFNLAAQIDNRTNLEIANLTSQISIEAARDSSSMITIAAVTMFFLPGTFVCAIFSTVFFDTRTDQNGKATITLSSRWWYFVIVTIPLTVLVFIVWILWQRRRETKRGIVSPNVSPTISRDPKANELDG